MPVPGEAKLYLPGLARISSTSSLTVCAGIDGLTASTTGVAAASVTASKSFSGSKPGVAEQKDVIGEVAARDQNRIAIRRRLRRPNGADIAAGAGDVLDEEVFAGLLR